MNPIDRRDPLCLHDGTLIWHRKLSMKRTDPVVLLSGKGQFQGLGWMFMSESFTCTSGQYPGVICMTVRDRSNESWPAIFSALSVWLSEPLFCGDGPLVLCWPAFWVMDLAL
jgi:hypothetical protein